ERLLGSVQIRSSTVYNAARVDHDDIARSAGEQDAGDGVAGRTRATDDDTKVGDVAPEQPGRIAKRRQHDDRRTVLVVVEHRYRQGFVQPALDLETPRRRDVLQVDAAERRSDGGDDPDDLFSVLSVQTDRHGVHTSELLEQDRLALHHRQCGSGPDVA